MNTLFRILIILAVAVLVGGVMYVGVNVAAGPVTVSNEEESRPQLPEGAEARPEEREEGDGIDLPGGMVKALVLMSIAGGGYSAVVWAGKKANRSLLANHGR